MSRFEGQVAIVTGAAEGLGFGISQRLGGEGARVTVVDTIQPVTERLKMSGIIQSQKQSNFFGPNVSSDHLSMRTLRQFSGQSRLGIVDDLVEGYSPYKPAWDVHGLV